jgi:septum formation protein
MILASRSPRREQLLAMLGFTFRVVPADLDETWVPGEEAAVHAERLARAKAEVAGSSAPQSLVVASDTVVVQDGVLLGKPAGADHGVEMLLSLAGKSHEVVSGVAVLWNGNLLSGVERVRVHFRDFDEWTARSYVATGEPLDKAGGYGIQGYGATLVDRIEGDYYAVMGLPIARLIDLLAAHGWRYNYRGLEPLR